MDVNTVSIRAIKLLMTIPEASAALGLCRSALYELLLTGEIASVKIGRARRIPLTALEEFVTRKLAEQDCSYRKEIVGEQAWTA